MKRLAITIFLLFAFPSILPQSTRADYVPICDPRNVDLRNTSGVNCVPSRFYNDDISSRIVPQQCPAGATACSDPNAIFCKSGHPNISTGIVSCYRAPGVTYEDPQCPPLAQIPNLPSIPGLQIKPTIFGCQILQPGGLFGGLIELKTVEKSACGTLGYQYDSARKVCVPTSMSGMINKLVYLCKGDTCDTGLGQIPTDPAQIISFIIKLVSGISGGTLVLMLIRGGFHLLTSTGDPQKIGESKEIISSVVVGFIMVLLSIVLLKTIGGELLNLPTISLSGPTNT